MLRAGQGSGCRVEHRPIKESGSRREEGILGPGKNPGIESHVDGFKKPNRATVQDLRIHIAMARAAEERSQLKADQQGDPQAGPQPEFDLDVPPRHVGLAPGGGSVGLSLRGFVA